MSKTIRIDRAVMYRPYVGLCVTEADFVKACRMLKIPVNQIPDWIVSGKDGTVHSMYNPLGDMCCLLCIRPYKKARRETDALIVHEAVHIWRNFMEEIGEEKPSSEFEAYGLQTLVLELLETYDKLTGKKR